MTLTRRSFVRNVSVVGGALTLGVNLSACSGEPPLPGAANDFKPGAFLRIGEDDSIVVQIPKAEMGQGVVTGTLTIIAEELEVDPRRIKYQMAPPHPDFNDPEMRLQITGGSTSTRVFYEPLREAGAMARTVLIAAAAQQYGIEPGALRAADGRVSSLEGQFSVAYGDLVATARMLPLPDSVVLKDAADFKLIGQFDKRLDAGPKSDGSARYAMDVQLPDCATAVVIRSPRFGGKLIDFDATAAMELAGLVDIFPIDDGVAVVAEGYWPARRAADAIEARFMPPEVAFESTEDIEQALQQALAQDEFQVVREDSPLAKQSEEGHWLEADYYLPFLAHATMEPQNATAWVRDGVCDLWLGSQAPDIARDVAAGILGYPAESVTVHNHLLGGGFGRRAMPDSVAEVVAIAARIDRPVKLVWSREDDTRHDYYRPAMAGQLRAHIDSDGQVSGWRHRLAGPSLYQQLLPTVGAALVPAWVPNTLLRMAGDWMGREDSSSVEGAVELPYLFNGVEVAYHSLPTPVPLGFWRSVGHSHTAFVVESFVDELAHATGEDPVAFRRRHLPKESRQMRVLNAVASAANWGRPDKGRFQGVAVHESFHSVVAEVIEISLHEGQPRLEKVYCAVDCGLVINPDVVRDQMESGIVFGLSAALYGKITLRQGAVEQANFHDYPVLRHSDMPAVEVVLLDSDEPPTGVGEPGTPPAAPALANAIFSATGQRLRRLPLEVS